MSEFVEEDSKLKARAVVKLRRENTNMLVLDFDLTVSIVHPMGGDCS